MAWFDGGSGGTDTSEVTATAADVVDGKKIVDADGNVVTGEIPVRSDSGNVTLTSTAPTKSYAAGHYANAHGATVNVYTGG